jgi:hypothetical protein
MTNVQTIGEAGLRDEISHVGDCLECLSMDVVSELEAILAGKTGDILRRVEEIHKAACDALRHAQAAEVYRKMVRA